VVNGTPPKGYWSPPRARKSMVATLRAGPGWTWPPDTITVPSSRVTSWTRVPGVVMAPVTGSITWAWPAGS
jgi:hypothetical protein